MRQHRALRLAGGAGGIELDRDVPRGDVDPGIVGALRMAPRGIVLPFRRAAFGGDDGSNAGQLRPDIADLRDEFRSDKQHRRLAVLDDEGDLGAGQPPVHRRHHHIGLHRAEQQFEIDIAVLAEIGDAFARPDAEGFQPVGDPIGVGIELDKTGLPAFELEGRGIAAAFRLGADHVGQICRFICNGHVSPWKVRFVIVGIVLATPTWRNDSSMRGA